MSAARGKIAVLLHSGWLYGTVNRGEFAKAIGGGSENHRTFRMSKTGWRSGSVVTVKGSHVDAWDWLSPELAKPKRRAAKPRAADARQTVHPRDHLPTVRQPLTDEQRDELENATRGLDGEAVAMLCIAANVNSVDDLTQATLPAFREVLDAHLAGVRA